MNAYQQLFDLTGRQALVIGGGSGIGAASARALAAFGAVVTCADAREEAADATAAAIVAAGGSAGSQALNLLDSAAVEAAIAAMPDLAILVCTPGINVRKPMLEITDEEFDRVVNLNLRGNFVAMRAAGRVMAGRGRGSIIVFSSIRSQTVEPGQSVYAATKAGIVQMARTLAAELGPHGVRVNAIAPGVVETPLTSQIKHNPAWYQAYADKSILGRWAQPDEMTGAVLLLASDAGSYMTGTVLFVDGGWLAADGRFSPPL